MQARTSVAVATLCVLFAFSSRAQTPAENFLILIADDFGVEKVKAYGEYYVDATHPDGPSTPNIDALAASGIRFNQAWATPNCSPMRSATLTGKWPFRLDMGTFNSASSPFSLDVVANTTLPQALGTSYNTAAVGKWHMAGSSDLDHPLDAGFDSSKGLHGNFNFPNRAAEAFDFGGYLNDPDLGAESYGWVKVEDGVATAVGQNVKNYATRVTSTDAVAYLSSGTQKLAEPWLLWVGFNAQHTPLHIPPSNLSKADATFHDGPDSETPPYTALATHFDDPDDPAGWEMGRAMAEAMDYEIGQIISALTATGEIDHTTIIFIGDNGTAPPAVDPGQDPDRVKGTPYQGGVRVPLIIRSDRNITTEAGKSVDALVSAIDIYSTVTELANVSNPTGIDSVSLVPYVTDTTLASLRDEKFSQIFAPNGDVPRTRISDRTIRNADYKLVRRFGTYQEFFASDGNGGIDEATNLLCPGGVSELDTTELAQFDALRAAMEALDSDSGCSGGKDLDRDGACDLSDHCPLGIDPLNPDSNGNGYGNACDADYDGSGIVGGTDWNIFRAALAVGVVGGPGWDPDWDAVDSNGNNAIGGEEFALLRSHLQKYVPGPSGTKNTVNGVQQLCN